MSESSDLHLQAALGHQKDVWIDHTVGEAERQEFIQQANERLQDILDGREIAFSPQESAATQPPLTPQAKLLAAFEAQREARSKNDTKQLRQITSDIIELQAEIRAAQPPDVK